MDFDEQDDEQDYTYPDSPDDITDSGDIETQLVKLPALITIVAPLDSGKTTLVKYLMFEHRNDFVGGVVFSLSGINEWEKNFPYINQKYIYEEWDMTVLESLIDLAKKIKKHSQGKHHMFIIFDDFIGMTKGLFRQEKAKALLTTLRQVNITVFISAHQIQGEVTPLTRNNTTNGIMFPQSEKHGIDIMFSNWVQQTGVYDTVDLFKKQLTSLEDRHFLHYIRKTRELQEASVPVEDIPNFRLNFSQDDEEEAQQMGQILVGGNIYGYDLSSIERQADSLNLQDVDTSDLFRKDGQNDEEDDGEDTEEFFEKPVKRKRSQQQKSTPKKKSRTENHSQGEETVLTQFDNIYPDEDLSREEIKAKFRAIAQIKYVATNPSLRKMVDAIYPEFWQYLDLEKMRFEDVLKKRRDLFFSFTLHTAIGSTSKKYDGVKLICRHFVTHGIGYKGPGLKALDSFFDSTVAFSTLNALEEIDPFKKTKLTMKDILIDKGIPLVEMMLGFKLIADTHTQLQAIGDMEMTEEEAKLLE